RRLDTRVDLQLTGRSRQRVPRGTRLRATRRHQGDRARRDAAPSHRHIPGGGRGGHAGVRYREGAGQGPASLIVIATTRAHGGVRGEQALPANVLRRIRQVEIKARILADEALLGTYRSVFRGSGLEFEEVREYEPGDDIRSIDWNVTARMGTPYIKKFREDRELNIFLAVDASASSWFGSVAQSKRELGAEVAALLALTAMTNNDKVGLLRFASGMQEWLPSSRGREHLLRVIRQ